MRVRVQKGRDSKKKGARTSPDCFLRGGDAIEGCLVQVSLYSKKKIDSCVYNKQTSVK